RGDRGRRLDVPRAPSGAATAPAGRRAVAPAAGEARPDGRSARRRAPAWRTTSTPARSDGTLRRARSGPTRARARLRLATRSPSLYAGEQGTCRESRLKRSRRLGARPTSTCRRSRHGAEISGTLAAVRLRTAGRTHTFVRF